MKKITFLLLQLYALLLQAELMHSQILIKTVSTTRLPEQTQ